MLPEYNCYKPPATERIEHRGWLTLIGLIALTAEVAFWCFIIKLTLDFIHAWWTLHKAGALVY